MAKESDVKAPPGKPLLFAVNPFTDERVDDVEFAEAMFDRSYVPGYSDIRYENEMRKAKGAPVLEQPRLQWVRIESADGTTVTHSNDQMMEWMRLGYRACGTDDLEAFWPGRGLPPTAHVDESGLIRRGDLALFILSAERAERNRVRQQKDIDESITRGPKNSTGALYETVEGGKPVRQFRALTPGDLPNL